MGLLTNLQKIGPSMDARRVRLRVIQWMFFAAVLLLFSTAIVTALVSALIFAISPRWMNEPHLAILFLLVLLPVAVALWRPLRTPREPHN